MRLGFFGGSFDPPHHGHLAVAQAVRDAFHLDRVLLAPVARQPLKHRDGHAGFVDRLEMVRLLCRDQRSIVASDVDAPRPDGTPNYTIDTLRRLQGEFQGAALFSIAGLDSFRSFREWRQPDELLQAAEWIVVSRPGNSFDDLSELALSAEQWRHVHELPSVNVPVSATEIRRRLAAGEPCEALLQKEVLAFIHAHHLYGT